METFPIINHNKDAIQDALDGNTEAIGFMFQWLDSSLKRDWFAMKYQNLEVDEEAKSYLRWLLKSDPEKIENTSRYKIDFRMYKKGQQWT